MIAQCEAIFYIPILSISQDAKATIRDIGRFLKRDLSADQLDTIVRESSFTKMKENPATNYEWFQDKDLTIPNISTYMRKGYVWVKLQPAIFPLSQHVIRFHKLPTATTQRFLQ